MVKRDDGSEARYVIDFYAGHAPPASGYPVAMHLDVRPALDSVDVRSQTLFLRLHTSEYVDSIFCIPSNEMYIAWF